MLETLNAIELRILSVMIEKSLAQASSYPMTINSITVGCNQKSNRDPMTNYDEGDVEAALRQLRQRGLASEAPPDYGARTKRFRHEAEAKFGWNSAERAIMCELMLRGPQTLGELRGHASRLTRLESIEYAQEVIEELRNADPPMVVELPRQPGHSSTRFAQLLGGAVEAAAQVSAPRSEPHTGDSTGDVRTHLASRVSLLEEQVDSFRSEFDSLKARFDAMGHTTPSPEPSRDDT